MKLVSIKSAEIEGDALLMVVDAQNFSTAFDGKGGVNNEIMPPEEMPFVFRKSDRNGLAPQVLSYLREHKADFDAAVQRWIEEN